VNDDRLVHVEQEEAGHSPEPRPAPEPPTGPPKHEFTREDGGVEWFTIAEAARVCRRSENTILNIISRYQLRRRRAWTVRGRRRERRILLAPNVVRWIQEVCLFRQPPVNPPR